MRRTAMILLAGLSSGPAAAQPTKPLPASAAASPAEALAALPSTLAGFRRGPIADFEGKPEGAGLGAAAEYRPEAGGAGVATVYVYDRGRRDLPEGSRSLATDHELATAQQEAAALATLRRYQVAATRPVAGVAGPDGAPALRCLRLDLVFESGVPSDSFVCAGVLRGRFLKLRLSLPAAPEGESERTLQAFGQAVVAATVGR